MKRRILFVGENQPLWLAFRAHFSQNEGGWVAEFARTGPEALAWILNSKFDAVFADVQLSDMTGVEFLDEIVRQRPKVLRIVLSDIFEVENTLKCIGKAHHHLVKPCDGPTVIRALNKALDQEAWLPSDTLQGLISQMPNLPSPPEMYFQIALEMQSPNASVETVGKLIARDPAIAAKVLQLANSAVFGLQLQVANPVEAVNYIGLETTKALVLLAHTFSSFEQVELSSFSIEALWRHSLRVGDFARRITLTENGDPNMAEEAFTAGLLHDLGKLLFAANLPQQFGEALEMARAQYRSLWEVESQVFGATHADVGACVLSVWGLPAQIVESVASHHHPLRLLTRPFSPMTAVFAANILEHEAHPENTAMPQAGIDLTYLKDLGLSERADEWRRSCLTADEEATAKVAVQGVP
jgi:HD-like signal output (HDOD) protein/CheY-like chemotaxis protein